MVSCTKVCEWFVQASRTSHRLAGIEENATMSLWLELWAQRQAFLKSTAFTQEIFIERDKLLLMKVSEIKKVLQKLSFDSILCRVKSIGFN